MSLDDALRRRETAVLLAEGKISSRVRLYAGSTPETLRILYIDGTVTELSRSSVTIRECERPGWIVPDLYLTIEG